VVIAGVVLSIVAPVVYEEVDCISTQNYTEIVQDVIRNTVKWCYAVGIIEKCVNSGGDTG